VQREIRLLLAALLVAGAAAGCTQSKLPRDAKVTISGTVADGAPLTGAVVVMRIEPTGFQALGGLGLAFTTLGMSCAVGVGEICRDGSRKVGTAGGGAFQFELTGEDLQDSLGAAQTASFTVGGSPRGPEISGPVTSESTVVQVTKLDLGALALWRPALNIGSSDVTASVSWSPLPSEMASARGYRAVFDDARGGVVWRQDGGDSATFDARLLEGTSGGVSVLATAERPVPDGSATLAYRSSRLPYQSGFGVPASRGARCASAGQPCRLTDGEFATPHSGLDPVVIELNRQLDVSLLAVRGCGQSCLVEVSTDRTQWTALATVTEAFAAVAPSVRPPARFVRITPDTTSSLTEVSVWDGDAAPPARQALAIAEPGTIDRQGVESLDKESSDRAVLIGSVAIVAVLAGVIGFVFGRRRSQKPAQPLESGD
jgi:hypothetical protein